MAAYEIYADSYQLLTYDLQAAIDVYTVELAAHASTTGVAAPAATSLVEGIVKHHGGLFVIVVPPPAREKQPLPKDAKYYRSPEERAKLTGETA